MDKKTVKMAYVVLHFNNLEDTRACVASIRGMDGWNESVVVIVDNASPNGTGRTLLEEYRGEDRVEVLLNDQNAGFSQGNNLGYRYVRAHYDPDFVTVCNNDVVFPEADYCQRVARAYAEAPFYVLGPDIYNPRLGIHQSPLGSAAPTEAQARRTILLNGLGERAFPLFWALVGRRDARRSQRRGDAVPDWDRPREGAPLMGACLIFSRDFVARRENAFEPVTFLYYEEYLLYNYCRRNGLAMAYRPDIHVLHNEGRATATLSSSDRERYRRTMGNIRRAAKVYLEDLRRHRA